MSPHPFLADPPEVIPLSTNAPIERVIAQVQFPPLHLSEKQELLTAFREAIKHEFPYDASMPMIQVQWDLNGGEPRQVELEQHNHRYSSAGKIWDLFLTDNFISLVCTRYDTRDDFRKRFLLAVQAASNFLQVREWGRLGLRFINRGPKLANDGLREFQTMLKPEYRGISGSELMEKATNCLFTAEWALDGVYASLRHGYLMAGATYDPLSVQPLPNPGWVLDLDIYLHPEREGRLEPFSEEEIGTKFEALADREYCIFRELLTEEFVRAHSGGA